MNYIGSKYSLTDFITESIQKTLHYYQENRQPKDMIFADLFAGTGAIGQAFKKLNYQIIANDIQYYSYVINKHYIENNSPLAFDGLKNTFTPLKDANETITEKQVLDYLNTLQDKKGFIYKNYSLGGTKGEKFERMYFTDINAIKCDSIRIKLEEWKQNNILTQGEYYYLLACLLNAVDKCANTASVYGAFLKHFKKSAQKTFELEPLPLIKHQGNNTVYNEDINNLIKKISGDILYLDPPYNERQYSSNYHLLETIAKYDNPTITGKTGLRDYSMQKSLYCSNKTVADTFEDLIAHANFKYIFLSYNNEGLMSLDTVKDILSKYGDYQLFEQKYRRFRADKSSNRTFKENTTTEYLHVLVKK